MNNKKFKSYCLKCPKKLNGECTELCASVLEFVEQDTCKTYNTIWIGNPDAILNRMFQYGTSKSYKQIIYELYFLDGKKISYIKKEVPYSRVYISRTIWNLIRDIDCSKYSKRKVNILKGHFIKKLSVLRIAMLNRVTERYVWMVIREHLIKNNMK